MGSGVAVVGAGRIGAPAAEQLARELPHDTLLVVDGDRVEERNNYPPFAGQPAGRPKVRVVESVISARWGPSGRRFFFDGFFPEDFSPALLRRMRVLVIAADNLRDRQMLEQTGRACGVRVVNVAGLDEIGQLTVYGEGPEAPCMQCELGPDRSNTLPVAGGGGPGCGPSAATCQQLARETARVVGRLLHGQEPGGLSHTFVNGRHRRTFRLTRSRGCPSPAHRPVEWRTVRVGPGATVRQAMEAANLDSVLLFNPVFAHANCRGCGATWGHRYRRQGTTCPSCHAVRPLAWEIETAGALADLPPAALGWPTPVCLRGAGGSIWVEVAAAQGPRDPLPAWLDGTGEPRPSLEVNDGR